MEIGIKDFTMDKLHSFIEIYHKKLKRVNNDNVF